MLISGQAGVHSTAAEASKIKQTGATHLSLQVTKKIIKKKALIHKYPKYEQGGEKKREQNNKIKKIRCLPLIMDNKATTLDRISADPQFPQVPLL